MSEDEKTTSYKNNRVRHDCATCGEYIVSVEQEMNLLNGIDKDHWASYLYFNRHINMSQKSDWYYFIGSDEAFQEEREYALCVHVTNEIVENWYPKSFSEKINMFLLSLEARTQYMGEQVSFAGEELNSACFVVRSRNNADYGKSKKIEEEQRNLFLDYIKDTAQQYISYFASSAAILPKGYERLETIHRNDRATTKNVFVAMAFSNDMEEVREAIKTAIIDCGYIPRIMNEIEHNHQIVPEMLYEIRKAKFVIAELTKHNNGAYYEAGYALGIGKDVIHVCRNSSFGTDGHFDVKQVNTILWDNTADLTEKLKNRIQATIE